VSARAQGEQAAQGFCANSLHEPSNTALRPFPSRVRLPTPNQSPGELAPLCYLRRVRIGECLLSEGHLTQEGLEEALDWQVLYGGRLGTNLLELQLVTEEQLARALGKQLGCEVAWGELKVDPTLLRLVPKHVADRQELVPWRLERRRVKLLVTEIHLERIDELAYRIGRPVTPVVAPEFRIFGLLRSHYGALRQMRALDFGVVPEEGRRRKKKQAQAAPVAAIPELIDETAFNDIYNKVLARQGMVAANDPPSQRSAGIEALPDDAILGELPAASTLDDWPLPASPAPAAKEPDSPTARAVSEPWEAPPAMPRVEDAPIVFDEALRLLSGVRDRDNIAHIVLRASRSKAARALLLQVQGGVALGWDGLGEGLENDAARMVAVPLSAPSAFQLVVKTRSHFMGPLHKTPINIRFLAQLGKKVPLSSLLFPILVRGRVSHLLYLDNGHKKQAPTDVGEMLILSQRIAQSVEALVDRRRAKA
jgi:Type II secretion system (T2SS), protein E, N-terminal domain